MTLSEQIEHTRQEQLLSAVYDSRDRHRAEMETEAHTMTHDEMIAVIAANRDGKKVQARSSRITDCSWVNLEQPCWDFTLFDYRIAPEPKRVPLGPEDFPPGTVVRPKDPVCNKWFLVTCVDVLGVNFRGDRVKYMDLVDNFDRLLPGTTEWLPCWKEVEA